MKKFIATLLFLAFVVFTNNAYSAEAPAKPLGKIMFTEPADGAKVRNPVKVCFENEGLEVVKWSKTNKKGQGHYHVLLDPKKGWDQHHKNLWPLKMIHQSKGENCHTLKKPLSKGKHIFGGLFSRNNHTQYNPVISTVISVEVIE